MSSNKETVIGDQPAVQPAASVTPDEPQTATAPPAENDQVVPDADGAKDVQPQPEVALEKKTVEKPEKKDFARTDEEVAVNEKASPKRQPHSREPKAREVAVDRQPVMQDLPERPRIVRRRDPAYGPPASSIEMIFTGIPPEHRRRWRRIYD